MKLFRDEGIVLRTHKLGEADRIITLLTPMNGKVRAVGKGVRRTKSRFGARLEPFSHVDCQFYRGRTLDIVTQAESLHAYGDPISSDYERYRAGGVLLETADKLAAEEGEPDPKLFFLLHGAIASLARGEHRPLLIAAAFLVRALSLAGFEMALMDCAVCSALGPHRWFSIPAGGAVCSTCRPPGAATVSRECVLLMADLLAGDWDRADDQPLAVREEARRLIADYAQWHLERKIRSLRLLSS